MTKKKTILTVLILVILSVFFISICRLNKKASANTEDNTEYLYYNYTCLTGTNFEDCKDLDHSKNNVQEIETLNIDGENFSFGIAFRFNKEFYYAKKTNSVIQNYIGTNNFELESTCSFKFNNIRIQNNRGNIVYEVESDHISTELPDGQYTLVFMGCNEYLTMNKAIKLVCFIRFTIDTKIPDVQKINNESEGVVYFIWEDENISAQINGKEYTKGEIIKEEGEYAFIAKTLYGTSKTFDFIIGHCFELSESIDSTCTQEGYTIYKCKKCGIISKENIIPIKSHQFTVEQNYPTCTEAGGESYVCKDCGYKYKTNSLLPQGHDYSTYIILQPNCVESGERMFVCDNCGDDYTETIPATGHCYELISEININGIISRTYTCTGCGESYTQELGNQYEDVANYVEYLFQQYSPYMWWVLLASVGLWSIAMGVYFAIAHKNEDKEKVKKMIVNYVIGLVVIAVIVVACPYLIRGIAALVT